MAYSFSRSLVLGAALLAALASACAAAPAAKPAQHGPQERAPAVAATAVPGAEAGGEVISAARLEAAAALKRRDFREAERLLLAEIERTGESDWLLGDLAQVRAAAVLSAEAPASAELDLAVAALDRAIALSPKSARLFALRGAVAVRERRYADARVDFGRALALAPDDAGVRLDAADLSAALRDFDAADREYRAALAAQPGDFETLLRRAIMLRARIDSGSPEGRAERYRAAHDALGSARAADPKRIEVQFHHAALLLDHAPPNAGANAEPVYLLAMELLRRFMHEAAGKPELAAEVARAKQMYSDIQAATYCNFRQTAADRKVSEAEARRRAAQIEAEQD